MKGDIVSKIMDFESGNMRLESQIVSLFQELNDTGIIYGLQGNYHRVFNDLVDAGLVFLDPENDERETFSTLTA